MSEIVEALRFKAGDRVPEWLLQQDPQRPDSVLAPLEFVTAGIVLDLDTVYYILSTGGGAKRPYRNLFGFVGTDSWGINLSAASKPVATAGSWFFLHPEGYGKDLGARNIGPDDAARFMMGVAGGVIGADRPSVELPEFTNSEAPAPVETIPLTLWERLAMAFHLLAAGGERVGPTASWPSCLRLWTAGSPGRRAKPRPERCP